MAGPVRVISGCIFVFNIEFTKWDKIDIKKPMLLCELKEYF